MQPGGVSLISRPYLTLMFLRRLCNERFVPSSAERGADVDRRGMSRVQLFFHHNLSVSDLDIRPEKIILAVEDRVKN